MHFKEHFQISKSKKSPSSATCVFQTFSNKNVWQLKAIVIEWIIFTIVLKYKLSYEYVCVCDCAWLNQWMNEWMTEKNIFTKEWIKLSAEQMTASKVRKK